MSNFTANIFNFAAVRDFLTRIHNYSDVGLMIFLLTALGKIDLYRTSNRVSVHDAKRLDIKNIEF